MPATTGIKGAGYYDQHSGSLMASIQARQDWAEDAVANLPLPAASQPITVLDLGSSEGRNTVRLKTSIVAGLRRRTDQPLQTIYIDLASNNFNRLFGNLERPGARPPCCGWRLIAEPERCSFRDILLSRR